MARTCIICGDPAGSREHIFPAALGGRRTNKGIYCEDHNQAFSGLADTLSRQLSLVNSLLGVRPDHDDEPRRHEVEGPDGERLSLGLSTVKFAQPRVIESSTDGATTTLGMAFADEQQLQNWLQRQRATGNTVQLGPRSNEKRLFTDPIKVPVTIGGDEFLRSIAYVALTYLANGFADVARQGGIDELKRYVQNLDASDAEKFVWWERDDVLKDAPANPYQFGHTIGVVVADGRAHAVVSLFDTLTLGIELGSAPITDARTVITHIDPKADHPPKDVDVHVIHSLVFEIQKPQAAGGYAKISGAEGLAKMQSLLRRIEEWQRKTELEPLLQLLLSTEPKAPPIEQRVESVVDAQEQRVWNMMQRVVADFLPRARADAVVAPHVPKFEDLIRTDDQGMHGLSASAIEALRVAKAALRQELLSHLQKGTLDFNKLHLLLAGGLGLHTVGHAIFELVHRQL